MPGTTSRPRRRLRRWLLFGSGCAVAVLAGVLTSTAHRSHDGSGTAIAITSAPPTAVAQPPQSTASGIGIGTPTPTMTPPPTPSSIAAASTAATKAEMSLSVPSIGLDLALQPQGLRDGEINPDPGQVIWFTGYGRVAPGEAGTSVVAGHVANGNSADAFANLSQIQIGDTIETIDKDGDRTKYIASQAYAASKTDLQADPAVWGATDQHKRLVLVTCDDVLGRRTDGHRAANFVVIARAM